MNFLNGTEQARLNHFKTATETLGRTPLIPRLSREFWMTFRQLFQRATFGDRVCQGLFAIDMFAVCQCRLTDGNMPVVGCSDNHGINSLFLIQQFAIVVIDPGPTEPLDLQGTFPLSLIDITNRDDLLIQFRQLGNQITTHLSPHADTGKRQSFVGRLSPQDP